VYAKSYALGTSDLSAQLKEVMLGRSLGLETVAEGVEDQATLKVLVELGCTVAQGNHIARPRAAANLIDWYAASVDFDRDSSAAA
jgi:EAL domain-containing protein (putative c-di-GMP-specific phosphodiesterase class I)